MYKAETNSKTDSPVLPVSSLSDFYHYRSRVLHALPSCPPVIRVLDFVFSFSLFTEHLSILLFSFACL